MRLWDNLLKQDRLESRGGSGDKFAVFEKIPLGTIKIAKAVLKEKFDWDHSELHVQRQCRVAGPFRLGETRAVGEAVRLAARAIRVAPRCL